MLLYRNCNISIFSATHKLHKEIKTYQELSENACEEVQVTGNIVCHGRWKRFHDGVNTEYSVEETAYTKDVLFLKVIYEWI